MERILKGWTTFELAWLAVFTAIGVYLCVEWGEPLLQLVTMLTGIFCVVLVAKGSIWNYAPGLVNVCGYLYLSWNNRLWGEVMLNVYFLAMQFIGFYMWMRNMKTRTEVKVHRPLTEHQWMYTGAFAVAGVVLYKMLLQALAGQAVWLDSTTTVLSVIAQLFMAWRLRDQWIVWIVVNIFSIAMWATRSDALMCLMWTAYLVNAFYGYHRWSYDLENS